APRPTTWTTCTCRSPLGSTSPSPAESPAEQALLHGRQRATPTSRTPHHGGVSFKGTPPFSTTDEQNERTNHEQVRTNTAAAVLDSPVDSATAVSTDTGQAWIGDVSRTLTSRPDDSGCEVAPDTTAPERTSEHRIRPEVRVRHDGPARRTPPPAAADRRPSHRRCPA